MAAQALVIACAGKLVGCVFFKFEDGRMYLSRLAVVPEHRGRGLAKKLVSAGEKEALKAGAEHVWLSVRLVLTELRTFYEGLGYVPESYGTHVSFSEPTFVNLAKRL